MRIQVKTINGCLQATTHNGPLLYKSPVRQVPNDWPDLPVIEAADVEYLGRIYPGIHRVRIGATEYCLKSYIEEDEDSHFIRELDIMRNIPAHMDIQT